MLSKKQQHLINAARALFCRYGIRRVTVDEICKQANVSKMTFYKYYQDKMAIARAVLEEIFSQSLEEFNRITSQEKSFSQQLEKLLMMITTQIHTVGSAFLEDLTEPSCPLHEYFSGMQKTTRALTVDFFQKGQVAGDISSSLNMRFLLFMFDRMSELLTHPELVAIIPDTAERASALAVQLLYGCAKTR